MRTMSRMALSSMAGRMEVGALFSWMERRAERRLSGRLREPRCSALKGGFLGADDMAVCWKWIQLTFKSRFC